MPNSGYRYHVFLSYKRARRENGRVRDDDVEVWVRDFFEPELQRRLTHALVEEAQIFLDRFEIRTGDEWKKTIVDALRGSFCLVPVWSPLYFTSRWCVSEWGSFRQRDKQLVVPVVYQPEVTCFPAAAKGVQYKDFSQFTYTTEAFRNSEKYLAFEDLVKDFARDVARAVKRAPSFDAGCRIVVPEISPALQTYNVLSLDAFPDRDAMLIKEERRVRRGDISLAA